MSRDEDANGFHVGGGALLDANGRPFVMRGVNQAHVWFPDRTPGELDHIAGTGANAVRVVLGNGVRWGPSSAEVVIDVIDRLKDRRMTAVLEVHDVTGYPEAGGSAPLDTAVDYWIRNRAFLVGQEAFVILNIGNEPVGNRDEDGRSPLPRRRWSEVHEKAIASLRASGIRNTLVVDGAQWGQDRDGIMLEDAPRVFGSDPMRNTVFSVHMYAVYDTREKVEAYFSTFQDRHELPLIVGEFGMTRPTQVIACHGIMELAEKRRIGTLAWSWSGNNEACRIHDLTEDGERLTGWGRMVVEGPCGIRRTARKASVFD